MNRANIKISNGGYVVIINTLFFLVLSAVLTFGIVKPTLASFHSAKDFMDSKQSFLLANSALEEGLYRLKNSVPISSSEIITLNSNTATVSVADTADGKILTIDSNVNDFQRDLSVSIIQGVGVTFNYGLQAGQGGFDLQGGAYILGNVYSNGDVTGNGLPYITGSATVANAVDPSAVVSNTGTTPPPNDIGFGEATYPANTNEDFAQSFTVPSSATINGVRLYMKKTTNEWKKNIDLYITNNSNGSPGKTIIASGSLSASQVTTSYNYLTLQLSSTPTLSPGTTYWIVLNTEETWNSRYVVGSSPSSYPSGLAKTGKWAGNDGGAWSNTSPSGLDAYFEIYSGGDTGKISGMTIYGDAWAHEITGSTITGTAYCQASNSNNKSCTTTRPDPATQPMPISDGNIEEWKAVALAGGVHTGNLSYGSDNVVSLGPKKVVGNLTVGGGATLNVTGTLWVTGNIEIQGGGKIKLGSNYGNTSGIIVSDGRINAGGGGVFEGNGLSGSYILVVTTSTCPTNCSNNQKAIDISGGAGAVIVNAQNGTIRFTGGGQAKQATGYRIELEGGASVRYETGIADMSFTSQPSGTWNITEWDER